MRRRILEGPPYRDEEMRAILDYCLADTMSLVDLLEAMLPDINIDLALERGDYLKAVAHQEYHGVPIDREVFPLLLEHLSDVQRQLIAAFDQPYGFYEDGQFRTHRFLHYLVSHGIPWCMTASGAPLLKDDYLKEQCTIHKELEDFRQLRKTISKAHKITIPIGKDFRHRTLLSPFGTVTGRNAPGRFLFGQAKWMRFLAIADPGWLLPTIDWSQQELGIGAVLSGDTVRQQAYRGHGTGANRLDFYMILAKLMGCTRDEAKVFTLAEQYAAGVQTLARLMKRPVFVIKRLLRTLHTQFPVFYDWVGRIVNAAYRDGKLETALGWQILAPKHGANTRTLRNFLVQGYGADLLRYSVARAVEAGVNVIGTMHDSVLIHAPAKEAYAQRRAMLDIMAQASRELLDGFELATTTERRIRRRYYDEKGEVMWRKVLNILEAYR
jgi:DNA polymerase-1